MGSSQVRNWATVLGFVVSVISSYISLVAGFPLSFLNASVWRAWKDMYKGLFGMLLVFMVALTSPARVRVYCKHENMGFRLKSNGLLKSTLSPRAAVVSNHQIYSDWIFLWWLAYTAGLECAPIVALKKSLKDIPVVGWAMRSLHFLFLSRKWADDEANIRETTNYLAEDKSWQLWLCLFPEGTVYNQSTHSRTREYAEKAGIDPAVVPKSVLLPRVKGLQAILQGLKGSVPVLYDITIVYEPKPPANTAAESFFSLGRSFIQGRGPQTVKMHIREIPMTQIPYKESEETFTNWLYSQWVEKDRIYEDLSAGRLENEFRAEAPVYPDSWLEIYRCFQVPLILVIAARLIYTLL